MKSPIAVLCLCLLFAFGYLAGCITVKPSSFASTQAVSAEPLSGDWAMTRTNIQPPLPDMVPGFVADQVFPKSPVWSIGTAGNTLSIKYDGKPIWFNSLGINVNPKPVSASESADKKSCTFNGGGAFQEQSLPGVLSMIGNIQNISINYTDRVTVTTVSQGQINASISYSASGTYRDSHGPENFNYSGTLTYTGKHK